MAAEKAPRVRTDAPVSLREAQKNFTRARLLQSAREVFEEFGYLDTTVEEIAERVGASRGTFYLHFPSKAAVMKETVASWRSSLQHFTESLPAGHEPTFEELRDWVEHYVDLYEQNKLLLRAWHQAVVVEPELAHAAVEEVTLSVKRWTDVGLLHRTSHHDERSDAEIGTQALLLHALSERFLALWLVHGMPVDRPTAVREIARSWYSTLFGETPPGA